MPLPLAHPAAVLPLRRFCPRFLSWPALVVGSFSPDFAYVVHGSNLEELSHSIVGTFVFCLPVGLMLMGILYAMGKYWTHDLHLARSPVSNLFVMLVSLLIGAWTHIAWDSLTNKSGWIVLHVAALRMPIAVVAGHHVKVCHLLWYSCSFLGVALLSLAYSNTPPELTDEEPTGENLRSRTEKALLCGFLALPIGAIHHLFDGALAAAVVALLSLGLLTLIVNKLRVETWMIKLCHGMPDVTEIQPDVREPRET